MTFPTGKKDDLAEQPGLQTVAPSPHMDALLRALEATDQALEPMTSRGMDGRTASILREIEKSGAIEVRTEGDDLWIDVIDRKRALNILDQLAQALKRS
tara:strand:- start:11020 stop:11316 length:297 start_codon:yes stop_codon:yes gene_type:complete